MGTESLEQTGRRRGSARETGLLWLGVLVALLAGFGAGLGSSTAAAAEAPPVLWGKEPLVCPTGSGAGQCGTPRGVAADPGNGHIFVADQVNRRVDEFNALGQFIKAWGWDVVQSGPGDDSVAPEDQFEICVPGNGDTCKAGVEGSGVGQISRPQGIAVDSGGNVYVVDRATHRVQKFDRQGNFLAMFGGEVNKTKVDAGGKSEEEENLCPFDPADECKAGTEGTGQGQFGAWAVGSFIAIDTGGTATDADDKVYVGDANRIQRFDAGGAYQGEIALVGKTVQGLAVDDAGFLYVLYSGNLHMLSPAGIDEEIPFEMKDPDGSPVEATAVAVDSEGSVYAFGPFSYSAGKPMDPIFVFDPEGNPIAQFGKGEFSALSTGLATNLCAGSEAPGNLYATNPSNSEAAGKEAFLRAYGSEPVGCFKARTGEADPIEELAATLNGTVNPSGLEVSECLFEYGTSTAYGQSAPCVPAAGELGEGSEPVPVHADIGSLEKGTVYHFHLLAKVGSELETGADEEFKTLGPPVISNDHTAAANDSEATLRALVNPEGFATSCRFDYTTQVAFEKDGFEGAQSTAPTAIGEDRKDHLTIADLKGLTPGASYRWRIVCANESGGAEGKDRAFSTYLPAGAQSCPNDAFRAGAAAFLPDCRAYEMVSPVDKNGGDIVTEQSNLASPGGYIQARPDGNALTYTAPASFAGAANGFRFNQYLAGRRERGEPGEGWSSEGIHPPVAGQSIDPAFFFGLFREFMAFSVDLCEGWLIDYQTPPPTAAGQEGYANLYRRDNCDPGAGGLEALTSVAPPAGTELFYVDEDRTVEGVSADSRHALFSAKAKLTAEAAEGAAAQLYDRFGGGLHLVSVLPDESGGDLTPGDGMGFAAPENSEAGSGSQQNLAGAVSADGSRVYWSTGGGLYLRQHPEQGIVAGECEGAAACTVPVSVGGSAFFWAASPEGFKALYGEGQKLYEFDLGRYEAKEEPSRPIADGVKGVVGASENLARIYFVSSEALAGAGQNSEEDEALEGEPNLYLEEGGKASFVATLAATDVGEEASGALAYNLVGKPLSRAARVSPDGAHIAFQSRAPLSGYDNSDAEDGRAAVEVFSYEAGGELTCVSCNPSGARPQSSELIQPYRRTFERPGQTKVPAAAWLPTSEHPLHASNLLSADGQRLFFNANDALLPRDANGAPDVYEWEAAGAGGCDVGDARYFAQNGGCLYLISSGESPYESEFWEARSDGRDVFFTTESSLLPQDPGSIDLYDARIEGGFPAPEEKAACEGEACQNPPAPPQFATPASSAYSGPANPKAKKPRRCPKGKRKVRRAGKVRCIRKVRQDKKKRRRAGQSRRAAR